MADKEEMVKQVLGVTVKQIKEGDMAVHRDELIMHLAERVWKLEARLAKVEGRL